MQISIESHVLNHHRRSGLMTYTEGLVNGMYKHDRDNMYSLLYYSLTRRAAGMPGPEGANFQKTVLRVPDREFQGKQWYIDNVALPGFFKKNKTRIFHRTCGYTMPMAKDVFRILTVHDLRTLTIGDNVWAQNIDNYKRTINSLDACVVVSECTKMDLVKYMGVEEKKIKVIYLGADQRFKPSTPKQVQAVREKYGLNEPFLLSIGSVPRKNIEGIIRGYAESRAKKDYALVLSCNFDVEKYRALAEKLGVGDRTIILSSLTDEDVVALFGACHAFVFPSLYEGFGLPILEAFQCGAPVITSNMSSCPEVAGDAALLVNPQDAGEIGSAIDQMCEDSALRASLIHKGFERAKLFNWDNYALEMKKVYAHAQ